MPPKSKFTRDEIISAAIQLVREQGMEAITARELGARLGSSARPIFTVFRNMEEVNAEVKKKARSMYKEYVTEGLKEEPAFRGVGSAYIRFAYEEPKLFQLLFMNEPEKWADLEHILPILDENYEVILQSVQQPYQLEAEMARRLYQHLWIYTHGIATLCATKVCRFKEQEIQTMMTEIFLSLLEKIKRSGTL
ncbi:MAG: TetR/AcrR family transcriptional regulator [Lachnospiraceae bacterium]|nr:TetR/AcrR family transcriptional regulator [Lachnospiraceae bacterium]